MQGAAQEGHMSPDGLAAGQAADGLVDDSLKNRRGQVFLGRALVDQWLNIGFGKYAAAGGDGVKRLIIFRVFVQSGGVRLEKRRHLVDEGAGAAGADAVHALLYVPALEINDFRVLAAQLDGHVRLGSRRLQSGGHSHDLLDEGHLQVPGQGQAAGTGDGRIDVQIPKLVFRLLKKAGQGLLNISKMALVVGEEKLVLFVQHGDLYGGGTDIDSQCICRITHKFTRTVRNLLFMFLKGF